MLEWVTFWDNRSAGKFRNLTSDIKYFAPISLSHVNRNSSNLNGYCVCDIIKARVELNTLQYLIDALFRPINLYVESATYYIRGSGIISFELLSICCNQGLKLRNTLDKFCNIICLILSNIGDIIIKSSIQEIIFVYEWFRWPNNCDRSWLVSLINDNNILLSWIVSKSTVEICQIFELRHIYNIFSKITFEWWILYIQY